MKQFIITSLVPTLLLIQSSAAAFTGYNLDAQRADGQCKTPADWAADFAAIRSWSNPAGTLAVRVFASSDCGTIWNILNPAREANIKILAGVWAAEGDGHFTREKNALNDVVSKNGCDFLAGISVGSEDLYRGEIAPSRLAEQVHDVRGMVRQYGGSCSTVPVGHVDTWTAWVNGANSPVISASDVIMTNGFPYWQSRSINDAKQVFQDSFSATQAVSQGKPVWSTETGWPTAGSNQGAAVPSVANLQKYWRDLHCNNGPLVNANTFWFSAFDHATREAGVEQNFGLAETSRQLKISLTC